MYTSVAAFVLANMPKVDQINLQEMAGTLNRAGATMTALLASIAAISLMVGGIGIMNIMMVSVTERTREIGIRRAVGAKKRDVLLQFLVEAVTLSLCGGGVGIVLGFLTSLLVTQIFEWPTSVPPGRLRWLSGSRRRWAFFSDSIRRGAPRSFLPSMRCGMNKPTRFLCV